MRNWKQSSAASPLRPRNSECRRRVPYVVRKAIQLGRVKRRPTAIYTVIKTIRADAIATYKGLGGRAGGSGQRVSCSVVRTAPNTITPTSIRSTRDSSKIWRWPHWSVTTKNLTSGKDGLSGKLQSNATAESNRKNSTAYMSSSG